MMKFTPMAKTAIRPGTKEPWFGSNGHLNAGSNIEAMVQTAKLMQAIASGEVSFDENKSEEFVVTAAQRRELLVQAYNDHSTTTWVETGSSIGAILYETAKRNGFMRRFLLKGDLADGSVPRVQLRTQNVTVAVATGPSMNAPEFARMKYLYPPEFYITGNVRVEDRDIAQGAPDLLEDTMNRSLEQINVVEDRTYIKLLDATVGTANPLVLMSGGMNPTNIAAAKTALTSWGLSSDEAILSADFWNDIVGNAAAFANLFDPVTQHEIVATGFLGTLLGMRITTDGFRDPNQKVVAPNDMYIISSAQNHGSYTDRGPVKVVPVDNYNDGVPARGWYFNELLSMVVANPRSVVKAKRV